MTTAPGRDFARGKSRRVLNSDTDCSVRKLPTPMDMASVKIKIRPVTMIVEVGTEAEAIPARRPTVEDKPSSAPKVKFRTYAESTIPVYHYWAMIWAFGVLTVLVAAGMTRGMDLATTQIIQAVVPRSWDVTLSVLSLVGSVEITTVLVIAAAWILKKNWKFVLVVLVIYGMGMSAELVGKLFLDHPNPPERFFRYQLPFALPSSGVQTGNSYPSGHSFRTVFLVILAWRLAKNHNQKIALAAYTAFMLLSRVSLGEHWTSDVIGGGLLGIILIDLINPSTSSGQA